MNDNEIKKVAPETLDEWFHIINDMLKFDPKKEDPFLFTYDSIRPSGKKIKPKNKVTII